MIAGGLFLGGCSDERYGYDDDRPHYHSASTVDFHYTSGRPYSRSYGPLYQRDGRYYYSRGGSYVAYDRPTTVYRGETRVVQRDINVRSRYDGDRRGDYYSGRRTYNNDRRSDNTVVRRTNVYRTDVRRDDRDDRDGRDGRDRRDRDGRRDRERDRDDDEGTRVRVIQR